MSRFKLTGMEKVRTWIEDSPPPIFGPDRDDVLAALERIQAQLEAAQAVVEAAICYQANQMAYERNVLFDALAVLAEQEKKQPAS